MRRRDLLDDGTLDLWEVRTLVPEAALAAADIDAGETIDASRYGFLNFDELGLSGQIFGRVGSIEAAPAIADGPGRVVLATVEHLGDAIHRVTLVNAAGTQDTLGVTAPHRFYSETRGAWVQTRDLRTGEVLRGREGSLTVVRVERQAAVERVYNFSVEADHVYYVGDLTALTHNAYAYAPPSWVKIAATDPVIKKAGVGYDAAAHKLAEIYGGTAQATFKNWHTREFDFISDQFIGQTTVGKLAVDFGRQARATMEAAVASGRRAVFHFEVTPSDEILESIKRIGEKVGTTPIVQVYPL